MKVVKNGIPSVLFAGLLGLFSHNLSTTISQQNSEFIYSVAKLFGIKMMSLFPQAILNQVAFFAKEQSSKAIQKAVQKKLL